MQKSYTNRFAVGTAGFLAGTGAFTARAYRNSATFVQDTWTIAIPAAPDASGTYSATVNGTTASAPTDASATQAELETALLSAIRNSAIYDIAIPTLDTATHLITLKARTYGVAGILTVTVNSDATTADLVATHTVTPADPVGIGFGYGVVRKVGDAADEARLPSAGTDKFLGVTLSTYAVERDGIGQAAKTEYRPNDIMDVVKRTPDGIWVPVLDLDISPDDSVYLSVATPGRFTKSSAASAIAVPNGAFVTGSELSINNTTIALLSLNLA